MSRVELPPDAHLWVLGMTRSGKTTWTKKVVIPAIRRCEGVFLIILDTKNEYDDITPSIVVRSPSELNTALYKDKRPSSPVIRILPEDITEALAEEYLRAAWSPYHRYHRRGDKLYTPRFGVRFLMDDIAVWYEERGGQRQPWLKKWTSLGAAAGRVGIWCTQRSEMTPKATRTQSELKVIFRVEGYDLIGLNRTMGPAVANAVAALPRYGYLVWSPDLPPPHYETYDPVRGKFAPRPAGEEL